ncbi:unnamed protein product [Rotaria sp. Silwood2]|nr:unnamed protein product [Rotaria sp. Silwood2]
MDIFQLHELTDDMMKLSHDTFYNFLEITLNKDLCELFRIQAIRDMSSLSSISVDELIQILNFDVVELNYLKKALGFVSVDGNFHLRLGFQNLLERLFSLVKSKKNSSVKSLQLTHNQIEDDILRQLTELWKHSFSSSNEYNIPIVIPWIKNIFDNFKKSKNKFSYDNHIQQFALLLLILGGRNCYEFLRLNLPGALPHISNIESLMRNQEARIIECKFQFKLLKEYSQSNNCSYVFASEDCTSSVCRIDYDAQINSFIGLSSPLIDGVPKPTFFRTDNFEELKMWFEKYNKSKLINLHMIQSVVSSAPPFILSTYGSDNKVTATDILKRWLYIHNQCSVQGVRVIGFSTDGDARYLRAMRLCSRFFAELPNLNLFKHNDNFHIKIPDQWSWFLMKEQQLLLFVQDSTHIATKFRNRLLSDVASMKMGDFSIDIQHLMNLIALKNKIDHNLIKCDVCPKDRQNFASCRRISSDLVLNLLNKNKNCKGTFIYLSLLHSIITGLIDKPTTIEQRLYHIWTVVFTCRFWWAWIQNLKIKDISEDDNSDLIQKRKANSFITKPTFWCIEINAHTLLYMILLVINNKLPIDALNTYLFNSQGCENTFRIARALSGPYSSNNNFTVKSFIKRCEKISIIDSIKSHKGQVDNYICKFPQHHKTVKEIHNYSINRIKQLDLTESDIEEIIKNAFESAKQYVTMVNMTKLLINKNIYTLPELSRFIKMNISKSSSKVIDYTEGIDFDKDSDEDESDNDENNSELLDDDDRLSTNGTDDEDDEGNIVTSLSDVERHNFQGCRIYNKINPQNINKYFRIRIGSSVKYLHKQTACWLLTDTKNRLSSDRLERVKKSEQQH